MFYDRYRPLGVNRSKGAQIDGNVSEPYLTDGSSDKSSLSGASDQTHEPSASGDVSEFTIVLLEEGKEYLPVRFVLAI